MLHTTDVAAVALILEVATETNRVTNRGDGHLKLEFLRPKTTMRREGRCGMVWLEGVEDGEDRRCTVN